MQKSTSDAMARSHRSVEPINPMARSKRSDDQLFHFEDPAAALNLSDDKWNDIVKENLKKFEEDKKTAVQNKLNKNKKIQAE